MRPDRTKELLKEWALAAGFDLVGVARLDPSEHGEALHRWLERGDQASMAWLARRYEERVDPRRLLPGAVSALCVALQYHPLDGQQEVDGDLWPTVARYARGEDYHLVMERRLRALGERIEEAFPGARTRTYVDAGPILERELAARAGLGSIGKNTVLMHPEKGSWLLLGELLLTLDLQPDRPYDDLCGSCTACLDACPTGALPEPYRLDSRRCISYWTIEHRDDLPEDVARALSGWVFGCDICQEVCPINESVSAGAESSFHLPAQRRGLDLTGLLGLARDEYVERFRRSPMKRARLEGLQRNAAAAMGRSRDGRYLGPLCQALENEQTTVRVQAARSLAALGGEVARKALESAVEREPDGEAREAILSALTGFSGVPSP